jgi:hypothetical protein
MKKDIFRHLLWDRMIPLCGKGLRYELKIVKDYLGILLDRLIKKKSDTVELF